MSFFILQGELCVYLWERIPRWKKKISNSCARALSLRKAKKTQIPGNIWSAGKQKFTFLQTSLRSSTNRSFRNLWQALKLINNRIVNGVYPIGCYSLMVHSHDRCVCGGIRDDLSSEWQSIGCGHSHARTKVADRVGTRLTLGFACVLRNSGCTLVSGGHRDRDHENITFVGDRMWGCFVQTGSNTAAITAMTVPRITANVRNQV